MERARKMKLLNYLSCLSLTLRLLMTSKCHLQTDWIRMRRQIFLRLILNPTVCHPEKFSTKFEANRQKFKFWSRRINAHTQFCRKRRINCLSSSSTHQAGYVSSCRMLSSDSWAINQEVEGLKKLRQGKTS